MIKPDDSIFEKFFSNSCTEEEYNNVISYLNSMNNEDLNKFMDNHINYIENKKLIPDYENTHVIKNVLSQIKISPLKKILYSKRFIFVAASIVFLIFLGVGLFYYSDSNVIPEDKIEWTEKITSAGERSILTFQDGTLVTLNSESKLKFPKILSNNIWEVYLTGEAYFEVNRDTNRIFIVHSENLSTAVLGTKFNINAFPEDNNISVSLVEGKIKISKVEDGIKQNLVVLQPSQQLVYNKQSNLSSFNQFDFEKIVGWKDNKLEFDDVPLETVLKKLTRMYGVEFELPNNYYKKIKISTKFDDNKLWEVVQVLQRLTGLEYKTIKENYSTQKIIFYTKNS